MYKCKEHKETIHVHVYVRMYMYLVNNIEFANSDVLMPK